MFIFKKILFSLVKVEFLLPLLTCTLLSNDDRLVNMRYIYMFR
ncbi:unnamed protein product [Larinioides sclopetarius]|uniref:Uncharacterized protein n=1 Tax=Larinioides sclopetarius TaxID=280406 RepID=A0AAV2AQW6_9ARAC